MSQCNTIIMSRNYKTIPVFEETKKRVIEHGKKGETFDQLINRLLDLDDSEGRPGSSD